MGSLQYQWSEGLMTYVSVSRGFCSGTFNPQPFSTTDLIPTFPEKARTYEAGLKFVSPNRDIRFNAAGFYDDYTNIQLGATTEENGVFIYRNANAAKAKIYGGEGRTHGRPSHRRRGVPQRIVPAFAPVGGARLQLRCLPLEGVDALVIDCMGDQASPLCARRFASRSWEWRRPQWRPRRCWRSASASSPCSIAPGRW
jgi:hypothetical protein